MRTQDSFVAAVSKVPKSSADFLAAGCLHGRASLRPTKHLQHLFFVVRSKSGGVRAVSGAAGMRSPQADYWRDAEKRELDGLCGLRTWDYVKRRLLPPTANILRCHFVYALKRLADGSVEKFKARLVADGTSQRAGIDYFRTFSTVVKAVTIRLILILAALLDLNLTSIDIRQAYLQASLTTDIYMQVPPGLPTTVDGDPVVCKLNRSLYGLKQAGREWATLLTSFLLEYGFVRSTIDTCMYVLRRARALLYVLVWVDDCIIADNSPRLRATFVTDLGKRFPVEDKGDLTWILGVSVSRDRNKRRITLSQRLYINDLVSKFGIHFQSSRSFDTPMAEGQVLSPADSPEICSREEDELLPIREMYMQLVGGLHWIANMTNPWIAYTTSQLSRFMTNPGRPHWHAALRVLIYLRDSPDNDLVFAPNAILPFQVYVDSSWETKFSSSGALFFFMGCLLDWFSKKQHSVSLSSAEAELFGVMLAARNAIFIRHLLVSLSSAFLQNKGPTRIFCDSKSAVDLSIDPVAFKKTKHILRAAEFLRDLVARLVVEVTHVPGNVLIADILTKPVSRMQFVQLLKLFCAYSVSDVAYLDSKGSSTRDDVAASDGTSGGAV